LIIGSIKNSGEAIFVIPLQTIYSRLADKGWSFNHDKVNVPDHAGEMYLATAYHPESDRWQISQAWTLDRAFFYVYLKVMVGNDDRPVGGTGCASPLPTCQHIRNGVCLANGEDAVEQFQDRQVLCRYRVEWGQ